MSKLIASFALAGLMALAGCGGSGGESADQQSVRQAFEKAAQAQEDGNAKGICDSYSKGTLDQFKQFSSKSCVEQLSAIKSALTGFAKPTVVSVKVNGDKATVRANYKLDGKQMTESIGMVKEDGAWKLTMSGTTLGQPTK